MTWRRSGSACAMLKCTCVIVLDWQRVGNLHFLEFKYISNGIVCMCVLSPGKYQVNIPCLNKITLFAIIIV